MSRLTILGIHVTALAVLLGVESDAQQGATPPGTAPILDIRLASTTPVAGFTRMADPDEDRDVYVAPGSLLTDIDVQHAHGKPVPDGAVVAIRLSPEAAARLREATSNAIGQHLAVLANGRLASVGLIVSAVPSDRNRDHQVTVGLTLPGDVADEVLARVAARWPARAP